jgi:hypothetical protein
LSVEDERSGRTTPENLDAIHFMIQDTWRMSAKKIAETLAMSWERVGYI